MDGKKLIALGAVVLLAVYMGAKMAGPSGGGLALAAAGAGIEPARGLVAATTGAPGTDTNRLVLVDTVTKRLAVYKINHKALGLIAQRGYQYDMKLDDSAALSGQDFTYDQIKKVVFDSGLTDEQKKSRPAGREFVLTTDGQSSLDANRIILVNPEEKRVVVYRLNGNQLFLVAARRYDEDLIPEHIPGQAPGDGWTRSDIAKARERNEAGLQQPPQ